MQKEQISQLIKQQLPLLIEQDKELQEVVLRLARDHFAPRQETKNDIRMLIDELRRDREEQTRKWEEQNRKEAEERAEQTRKWEEQNRKEAEERAEQDRKWEGQDRKWDGQDRKWEEQNRKWDEARAEDRRKWDEQNQKWEEQNRKWDEARAEDRRKWEENQQELDRLYHEVKAVAEKHDRSIGALGARWGMRSERSFRNALAAILEKSFGVEVLTVTEYDDKGYVFGHPDQVELDVIIKNGTLLLCEIKSSVSKADLYIFERKVRFYEQRHERKANRMLVISPMVAPNAIKIAEKLDIEIHTDSEDVPVE